MSTVLYILLAIIIFGVLIGVHELGHFLAARACGVKVLEFSMGMGPLLWQRRSKRDTLLSLRLLPIGGFCAMEGEDEQSDDPRSFSRAALWKRLIILVAGAFMNFVLGFVLILVMFSPFILSPQISAFAEGCPYEGEQALMVGDEFLRINGRRILLSSDVAEALDDNGGSDVMDIVLRRDGEKVYLENFYMPRVAFTDGETGETVIRYGFDFGTRASSLGAKLKFSWLQCREFMSLVWQGLRDLVSGVVGIDQMSGVVGIVDVIAETGETSASIREALLNIGFLSAFIAVNLAVMNLLPLPALDGGRIFLLAVTWLAEKLLRRKVDPKYESYINAAGLMLLMALMIYVMYNDIARIIAG